MNRKKLTGIAIVVVLIIGSYLFLQQKPKEQPKSQLQVAVQNPITTLDPNFADDIGSNWAETQTLEGLYTLDDKGQVVAGMAEKVVKPTVNNTVYTIKIKANQKWSDGTPVTADDFVNSAKRQVNPASKSKRANHFKDLANYDSIRKQGADINELGISAPDKATVKIQLSHPVPYFNFILANQLYPINMAKVQAYGKRYGQTAETTVSNGAYAIKNWNQSATTWQFVKNPYYANKQQVHYQTINTTVVTNATLASKQYLAGKVDEAEITGSVLSDLKKQHNKDIKSQQKGRMVFIVWNAQDKIAGNTNFKRAVSYAINRDVLAQQALGDGSTAAKSIVPSGEITIDGQDFNHDLSLPFDKTKAQAYLKKAQDELGTKKISLNLNLADTDAYRSLSVYLKERIESVLPDVTININRMPLNAEISAFNARNFQAGTLSWSTDYNDPIDFLDMAYSDGAINFTKWQHPDYDQLIQQINQQGDATTTRFKLEKDAAKLNNDLNGVTPLYQMANVHLLQSHVRGLTYPVIGYQNYKYAK